MSTFICEHCGKMIIDGPRGYVSGCEHYPMKVAQMETVIDAKEIERVITHNTEDSFGELAMSAEARLTIAEAATLLDYLAVRPVDVSGAREWAAKLRHVAMLINDETSRLYMMTKSGVTAGGIVMPTPKDKPTC